MKQRSMIFFFASVLTILFFWGCSQKNDLLSPEVLLSHPELTAPLTAAIPYSDSTWQLVWSDEFNNTSLDTAAWNYETGGGGWGNSELQYYTSRPENVAVSGGTLKIIARKESYSGYQYTSGRITTMNKKVFKFGKIEARMKLPTGQGFWPAFWMLGQNIGSVGWPACGEIDIMENVNGGNWAKGSIHWADAQNKHQLANGDATPLTVTDWHTYSICWDATTIDYYVDGSKYLSLDISASDKTELRLDNFLILNLAVGGVWPGSPDASTPFPSQVEVDYVRVFQVPPPAVTVPGKVQAELWKTMLGVQTEACSDTGAGLDVGWIDAGDWMDYDINVSAAGSYVLDLRVAALSAAGNVELRNSSGTVLASLTLPITGGWQTWNTATTPAFTLPAGAQTIRVYGVVAGWNLNWIEFRQASAPPPVGAPVISSVAASAVTVNSADIIWTTDIASDSRVDYGTTTTFGKTATSVATGTSHKVTLTGLTKKTKYYYKVTSTAATGSTTSTTYSFTTKTR